MRRLFSTGVTLGVLGILASVSCGDASGFDLTAPQGDEPGGAAGATLVGPDDDGEAGEAQGSTPTVIASSGGTAGQEGGSAGADEPNPPGGAPARPPTEPPASGGAPSSGGAMGEDPPSSGGVPASPEGGAAGTPSGGESESGGAAGAEGAGAEGGASSNGGSGDSDTGSGGDAGASGGESGAPSGGDGASAGAAGDTGGAAGSAGAPAPPAVFFSEYVEGSGNKKALEIATVTPALLDECVVRIYANGNTVASRVIALSGQASLADPYVVCAPDLASLLPDVCDQEETLTFNGNDAVLLFCADTIVDSIGRLGEDPGASWASGEITTVDATLSRLCEVLSGDPNPDDPFDPAEQWTAAPLDSFEGLGAHCL